MKSSSSEAQLQKKKYIMLGVQNQMYHLVGWAELLKKKKCLVGKIWFLSKIFVVNLGDQLWIWFNYVKLNNYYMLWESLLLIFQKLIRLYYCQNYLINQICCLEIHKLSFFYRLWLPKNYWIIFRYNWASNIGPTWDEGLYCKFQWA